MNFSSASTDSLYQRIASKVCFPVSNKNTDNITGKVVDYFPKDGRCTKGYKLNDIRDIFRYAKTKLNKFIDKAITYDFKLRTGEHLSTTVEVLTNCSNRIGSKRKMNHSETINVLVGCGYNGLRGKILLEMKNLASFYKYHFDKITSSDQKIIFSEYHTEFYHSVDIVNYEYEGIYESINIISNGMSKYKNSYEISNDFLIREINYMIQSIGNLSENRLVYRY
ncbi:hypothetical protein AYI70_g7672 [Smittium culicis]|uniref:Uncharacterized protein n=1 Tax=Smittium culicis TaxID=133412 RepID=A0A1R1XJK2_9FUNG|nr:hypothetical protein AYI70_g7672 [Smittium culicis]